MQMRQTVMYAALRTLLMMIAEFMLSKRPVLRITVELFYLDSQASLIITDSTSFPPFACQNVMIKYYMSRCLNKTKTLNH